MAVDNNTFLRESSALFADAVGVLATKTWDYNPDNIVLLDVLRQAYELGLRPEHTLWVLMSKQLSAVRKFVMTGVIVSEPLHSRCVDLANYAALLYWLDTHRKEIYLAAHAWAAQHECPPGPECDLCGFKTWLTTEILACGYAEKL